MKESQETVHITGHPFYPSWPRLEKGTRLDEIDVEESNYRVTIDSGEPELFWSGTGAPGDHHLGFGEERQVNLEPQEKDIPVGHITAHYTDEQGPTGAEVLYRGKHAGEIVVADSSPSRWYNYAFTVQLDGFFFGYPGKVWSHEVKVSDYPSRGHAWNAAKKIAAQAMEHAIEEAHFPGADPEYRSYALA